MTALILTTSYNGREFFRIGYYVYNNYSEQDLVENPPDKVKLEKVRRSILVDKPRITRFDVLWKEEETQKRDTQTMRFEENLSVGYDGATSLISQGASLLKTPDGEPFGGGAEREV